MNVNAADFFSKVASILTLVDVRYVWAITHDELIDRTLQRNLHGQ